MIDILGNHISVDKGDTGGIVIPFKSKCKDFDLYGWTVHFIVKQKGEADEEAIIDLEETIVTHINTITIYLTVEDTSNEPADYDWSIWITKDADVYTTAEGIFTIRQGVRA